MTEAKVMEARDLVKEVFNRMLQPNGCILNVNGVAKKVVYVDLPTETGQSRVDGFRLNFEDGSRANLWWKDDFDSIQLP